MRETTHGKRRMRAEASKAAILAVARLQFEGLGFEAVSLRDIAESAGCSTGAIFVHWRNKEALFAAAMGRPYLNDARGARLLSLLQAAAPDTAAALVAEWGVAA